MSAPDVTIVHANPWFSVVHRPDVNTPGAQGWFRVVRPDSVMVVALLPGRRIIMVAGVRDTTGARLTFELPSGAIDSGEGPEDAATRELREETGFLANSLVPIGHFVEAPGVSASRCFVFEAPIGQRIMQALEPGEDWTPTIHAPEEVARLQASGHIVDGATLAALRLWDLRVPRE